MNSLNSTLLEGVVRKIHWLNDRSCFFTLSVKNKEGDFSVNALTNRDGDLIKVDRSVRVVGGLRTSLLDVDGKIKNSFFVKCEHIEIKKS